MAMIITLTSTNSNLTQRLSLENNSNIRDPSFSSYLNSSEESFVQKLEESSRDINPAITKGEDEDGEIGIFGAEKYFNGSIDHEDSKAAFPRKDMQFKKDDDENLDVDSAVRSRIQQPGTPSVRSESSWNSQSMLLNSVRRIASQNKTKRMNGKSFFGGLGCRCSCYDKNSVDIHEQVGEVSFISRTNKPHSDSWARDKNLLNHSIEEVGVASKKEKNHVTFPGSKSRDDQSMQPRKSLEVFGSPVYERKSESLALDHHIRPTILKAEFELSSGVYSDCCESDSSSDLFEIESLTGKGDPYLKKQVSDATLSDCATPCYAPSEASIEWSIVTASAADFSTVSASDYEDHASMPISCSNVNKTFLSVPYARTKENKDRQRKAGGHSTLLACNNHKAVNVAVDQVYSKKTIDQRMSRKADSFMRVSRFQAEHSKKQFDTKHGHMSSMSPSQPPVSS